MRRDRPYVGRLAPAPTGALHLGNARTFLAAWLRCRSAGGRLILRVEDLDHPKVKPGAADGLREDLRWLGLDWDEGPEEGPALVQSSRIAVYREGLGRLIAAGRAYPCVCTRRDVEAAGGAPHEGEEVRYAGTCRGRYADAEAARTVSGREPCWRFRIEDGRETRFVDALAGEQVSRLSDWSGDFVIARALDRPAYQLAVVLDDFSMGVTEVVRGDDLMPSTHRQLALYEALGLPAPSFFHAPLVVGPDGKRLAKRHGDTRISAFRSAGVAAARLVGSLARTLGIEVPGEAMPADLVGQFDPARIPRERIEGGRIVAEL